MVSKPVNKEKQKIDALYNYSTWFSIYKKLPLIVAGLVVFIALAWALVDIFVFSTVWNPYYYEAAQRFGLFQLDSWVPVILIWLGAGIVLATPFWFFTKATVATKLIEMEMIYKTAIKTIENEEKLNDCMTKIDEKILAPKAKK